MADFQIGAINTHITNRNNDAFLVSDSLTGTPAFQRLASSPRERDAFIKSLNSKKVEALARNDVAGFNLIGSLLDALKGGEKKTEASPHKFDSNDYLYS